MFESTKVIELGSCCFRQPLADSRFSSDGFGSHCGFLHGYFLTAKFWFTCNELDERNWVMDFGSLKELKKDLENQFDHTLVVSSSDPFLEDFKALDLKGLCDLRIMNGVGIEKFAEYCFHLAEMHVNKKTSGRAWVTKVEVWEHPKNSAIFQKGD